MIMMTDMQITLPNAGEASVEQPRQTKRVFQGQTAGKLTLHWDNLNTNERIVLGALNPAADKHRKPLTIKEIADITGWVATLGTKKANSWVRNSMRRLVRAELVSHAEKVKDGKYVLTDSGKRMIRGHMTANNEPTM